MRHVDFLLSVSARRIDCRGVTIHHKQVLLRKIGEQQKQKEKENLIPSQFEFTSNASPLTKWVRIR
jgi:hypothetical protein